MEDSLPVVGVVNRPFEERERYRKLGVYSGQTLFSILERGHKERGPHLALVAGTWRLTYTNLYDRVERTAACLDRLGLRQFERVVLQLPNTAALVETLFALFRLGAIPVMALPGHRLAEVRAFCEISEASMYIAGQAGGGFDYRTLGTSLRESARTIRNVLFLGEEGVDWVSGDGACSSLSERTIDPGQVALLQLSGGSTGTPKLIPRTHEDYLYSILRSAQLCELGPDSTYLAALPGSHNFPLTSPGILGCLSALGTVVLAPDASPDTVFPLLTSEKVTITAAVPALARTWLEAAQVRRAQFPSLRVLQVGGARLDENLARRLVHSFGCTLQQVFGMAEGLVNYTRLDDPLDLIVRTQGRPMSQYDEVRIVDDQDRAVAPFEEGHLLTRGPYTIRGYYKAEAHNAQAFTGDGFYRTGDIARQLPSGHLIVTGRAKEQINRAGEKIAPAELEEHLIAHASIREVAIVGVVDERLGERIVAFVVPDNCAVLRKPDVLKFLRERGLATFKMPDQIVLVPSLPKTNVGKVDKVTLERTLP